MRAQGAERHDQCCGDLPAQPDGDATTSGTPRRSRPDNEGYADISGVPVFMSRQTQRTHDRVVHHGYGRPDYRAAQRRVAADDHRDPSPEHTSPIAAAK